MIAGLIAGSIAAIVASLVSLPLRSPVDSVFNTATITVGSLVVGFAAGLLWNGLSPNPRRIPYYVAALAAVFVLIVVIAVVGNSTLDRFASFVIPLAAIVFLLVGLLTPSFRGISVMAARGLAVILLVASVGLGIGLMGEGDTESGELSLPKRVEAPTPTLALTLTPTEMQTEAPTEAPTEARTEARTEVPAPTAGQVSGQVSTDTPEPTATEEPSPTPATGVGEADVGTTYVVGDGSEITFTVGEVLTRFPNPIQAVMRTTELSGQINLDGQPSTIDVDLHSLSSDQEYRDRYVRRSMFPSHPTAAFTVDSVTDLPPEFQNGETFQSTVSGTLNLNGADFPLTFDLEVRNDGSVLNVLGRTIVTWGPAKHTRSHGPVSRVHRGRDSRPNSSSLHTTVEALFRRERGTGPPMNTSLKPGRICCIRQVVKLL